MKLSTFSILARDPDTGFIGIAGGTNWFCYGRWVSHLEAGYGVLATQAETNMWYAPNGLENFRNGMSAQESLTDLLKREPDPEGVYQLLLLDNNGNTACHTGENNYDYAGHICEQNLVVAGNTLVSEDTLIAVAETFKKSTGELALRMIKALQAGQSAGGDIRGMKSAALKVAKGESSGQFWNDVVYDLRVDENIDPLKELERVYYVAKAYSYIDAAETSSNLDPEKALNYYKKGLELDPTNTEIKFWMARILQNQGKIVEAESLKKEINAVNPNWKEYWRRMDETL